MQRPCAIRSQLHHWPLDVQDLAFHDMSDIQQTANMAKSESPRNNRVAFRVAKEIISKVEAGKYHTAERLLALLIINQHTSRDLKARSYAEFCKLARRRGNTQMEQQYADLALSLDPQNPYNHLLKADTVYNDLISDEEAVAHIHTALELANKSDRSHMIAFIQANLQLGNFSQDEEARKKHYAEAYECAMNYGHNLYIAKTLIALGNSSYDAEQRDRLFKALSIARRLKNKTLEVTALISLGNAKEGDDGGFAHYNKALSLLKPGKDNHLRAKAYAGMANIYSARGDNYRASVMYARALESNPNNLNAIKGKEIVEKELEKHVRTNSSEARAFVGSGHFGDRFSRVRMRAGDSYLNNVDPFRDENHPRDAYDLLFDF